MLRLALGLPAVAATSAGVSVLALTAHRPGARGEFPPVTVPVPVPVPMLPRTPGPAPLLSSQEAGQESQSKSQRVARGHADSAATRRDASHAAADHAHGAWQAALCTGGPGGTAHRCRPCPALLLPLLSPLMPSVFAPARTPAAAADHERSPGSRPARQRSACITSPGRVLARGAGTRAHGRGSRVQKERTLTVASHLEESPGSVLAQAPRAPRRLPSQSPKTYWW